MPQFRPSNQEDCRPVGKLLQERRLVPAFLTRSAVAFRFPTGIGQWAEHHPPAGRFPGRLDEVLLQRDVDVYVVVRS